MTDHQQDSSAGDESRMRLWRRQFHALIMALEYAASAANDQTILEIMAGIHQALHWGEPATEQLKNLIDHWRKSEDARRFGSLHKHRFQPRQTSDPKNN